MATIVTRSGKGAPLTNGEVDANFNNLNSDKAELSGAAFTGAITTNSTFDGVDVATRDGILSSTTTTANAALPKAGGALTGALTTNSTIDGRDVNADGILATNALPKSGGTVTGNVSLNDNVLLGLGSDSGSGSDLILYHDGTNAYVNTSTGDLRLSTADAGSSVQILGSGETLAEFSDDGDVDLFHDGSLKFSTTSAGINIVGNATLSGTVDGVDIASRDGVLSSTTTTANAALPKAGGAMTGAIAMGTSKITGAGNPTAAQDVATKAYVDSAAGGSQTLAETLALGNRTAAAGKIEFRDAAIYINSSADGQLDIVADTEIQIAATTVDLNGVLDVSGNIVVAGTVDGVDIASRDGVLSSTTTTAGAALPKAGGAMTGAITTNSTFDGRDVATDGTKLDGIEASADVTDTANVVASLSAGTGIGLSAGGAISNTAPDQTVALTGSGATSISGTYPNFTISSVNTTYSVGDGGLSQINFTSADHTKLNGIATGATNVTNNNQITNGRGFVTSSGNTVIGTDADINTSGAIVVDQLNMTDGVIQSHSTRTMTLANLGYTGATNANNYSFPYTVSATEGNSTIVQRNSSGYVHASYFNGTGTFATGGASSGMGCFTGTNGSDTYGRSYNAAAARTLLNVENGATADQTAAQILTAVKTVDGTGSGLDADTVDGIQGASLLRSDAADTCSGQIDFTAGMKLDGHVIFNGTDTWFRSLGATGWYSATYGGGMYMTDTTWVRTYASKALYVANEIAATGNITAYYSDERLKTKTGSIDNALDKVQSLHGFTYVENELARSLGYSNEQEQVALSAQDVQRVMPQAVSIAPFDMETDEFSGEVTSKSGEDYLTVDYAKLVPLLVESIKELKAEIDVLKGGV